MKKIYSLMFAMGAVCAASLTSCSGDSLDAEYVAVKESRSGNWSFYSPDGDVICKDEFKHKPSPVINGYFYVPEGNSGLYTLYKIGEKPEAVKDCDGLFDVGYMNEGLVPIVKKDARISFVDKNGEVKFTLEPIGGKEIREAQSFVSEGMIAVRNEDYKWGFVNAKGEKAIDLKYAVVGLFYDGMAVVAEAGEDFRPGSISVIDKTGEKVFKLKDGYNVACGWFQEGYLLCTDANGHYVLIDKKGETAYKFKDGVRVKDYNKKYALIHNSDGYGVITLDGETVIKPGKFTDFQFVGEDKFLAFKDRNTVLLDAEGEEVKDFDGRVRYNKTFGYYSIGRTTTFIDEDGKDKKDASFFNIGGFEIQSLSVRSAYKANTGSVLIDEAAAVEEVADSAATVAEAVEAVEY